MWFRLAPYGLALLLAAGAYGSWLWRGQTIEQQAAKIERLETNLANCGQRFKSLIENKELRNEVDNFSADDLRDVPEHWLLPGGESSPN